MRTILSRRPDVSSYYVAVAAEGTILLGRLSVIAGQGSEQGVECGSQTYSNFQEFLPDCSCAEGRSP